MYFSAGWSDRFCPYLLGCGLLLIEILVPGQQVRGCAGPMTRGYISIEKPHFSRSYCGINNGMNCARSRMLNVWQVLQKRLSGGTNLKALYQGAFPWYKGSTLVPTLLEGPLRRELKSLQFVNIYFSLSSSPFFWIAAIDPYKTFPFSFLCYLGVVFSFLPVREYHEQKEFFSVFLETFCGLSSKYFMLQLLHL